MGTVNGIFHFTQSRIPEVRFEWHPGAKIVYVLQTKPAQGRTTCEGDPIANDIMSVASAQMAAIVWCRGYWAHKVDWVNRGSLIVNLPTTEVQIEEDGYGRDRIH